MNKNELIRVIAEKSILSKKDSEKALNAFEEAVTEALVKGDKVQLVGFGVFDVAEREGRNPQTREPMKIAASKSPRFRVGKTLKDAVNM